MINKMNQQKQDNELEIIKEELKQIFNIDISKIEIYIHDNLITWFDLYVDKCTKWNIDDLTNKGFIISFIQPDQYKIGLDVWQSCLKITVYKKRSE